MAFLKTLAIATLLFPATLTAQDSVPDGYGTYKISKAQMAKMHSSAYKACRKQWLGSTGGTLQCLATEIERTDTQLEALFNARMAKLKPAAQARLGSTQNAWRGNRYDECAADYREEDGGTLRSIVRDECILTEILRRTAWVKRFK